MRAAPSPRRAFAVLLVSMLLMQGAWILTMPAFRGIDEFDHVYKAAAVARGQWTAPDGAPHGRGGIVTIPASIVHAASRVCQSYSYVGHDNCFPIGAVQRGQAEVATAAGSYNPSYYMIVGNLARPFGGAGADYAMRIATALICAFLIAWAAAVIARSATTVWPLITLAIGLTPVLVYSTAIAAPNGVTYASAVLVWASVTGLVRLGEGEDSRRFALPLAVGSVALVTTHTSGAMWLALIGVLVILLRPLTAWTQILRAQWRTWLMAAVVVVAATVACAAWIRYAHTNALGTEVEEAGPFPYHLLPTLHALWTLQAVAVFPTRNEPAPAPVYVIWGVLLVSVLVLLFRYGTRREKCVGAATLVAIAVVPSLLTVMTYRTEGAAWQGRYALPLWIGITTLTGLALDRRRTSPSVRLARVLFTLLATATAISTVHVGVREISSGPAAPLAADFAGGMLLVGLLSVLGALSPLAIVRGQRHVEAHARSADPPVPVSA